MVPNGDCVCSTKSQLNQWLRAQRSTGTLQRKGGRLKVVSEEVEN